MRRGTKIGVSGAGMEMIAVREGAEAGRGGVAGKRKGGDRVVRERVARVGTCEDMVGVAAVKEG